MTIGARLNTATIANSGATLVATCTTALGGMVTSLATGGHPPIAAIALAFAGLAAGGALAYLGRPSTIPPTTPTQ